MQIYLPQNSIISRLSTIALAAFLSSGLQSVARFSKFLDVPVQIFQVQIFHQVYSHVILFNSSSAYFSIVYTLGRVTS